MLDEMSNVELQEWMAFDSIQPIGDYRDDIRIGQIALLLANINRKPDSKPFDLKDFLLFSLDIPPDDEEKEEQKKKLAEGMQSFVELMNQALGGRDLRPKDNIPLDTLE